MKRLLLIHGILLLFAAVQAQDHILTLDSTVYSGRVMDVRQDEVTYQPQEDTSGPLHKVPKDSVLLVTRASGGISVYHSEDAIYDRILHSNKVSLYDIGAAHGRTYYDQYDDAQYSVLASTIIFSPGGLLVSIISSSITPSEHNLNYPNSTLWKNDEYRTGYSHAARKVKGYKVWDKFGLGLGINIAIAAAIYLFVR